MLRSLKRFFRATGLEVARIRRDPLSSIVSLRPHGACRGNALLSYVIEPQVSPKGTPFDVRHTTQYESFQIGQTLLDLGYALDVIQYTNTCFKPTKKYEVYIGVLESFGRLAPRVNTDCIKVLHAIYSHCLFNNASEYQRLLALNQRRGAVIQPRKLVPVHLGVEYADYVTVLGNQFTMDTYRYAGKPMFKVPGSANAVYPWPEHRNFELCRNRFIWFGGADLVHKGLDLTLEAFARLPDLHLTVAGPVKYESDFESAYYRELYQTSNIRTVGWLDVTKPEFTAATADCVALVYPSCSEGQAGAVINCMHAGLIPVVSYQSGVDVGDFGVILKDCTLQEIMDTVRMLSGLSADELERRSRAAWNHARKNHTRECFAREYRRALETILAAHTSSRSLKTVSGQVFGA